MELGKYSNDGWGIEKSMASLTFNLRDNEIEWATLGTVVVDGCNTFWCFKKLW